MINAMNSIPKPGRPGQTPSLPFRLVVLLAVIFLTMGSFTVRAQDCSVTATAGVLDCTNNLATMTATASSPGATYQWTGPGVVSGGNSATVLVNQPGLYRVTATDLSG